MKKLLVLLVTIFSLIITNEIMAAPLCVDSDKGMNLKVKGTIRNYRYGGNGEGDGLLIWYDDIVGGGGRREAFYSSFQGANWTDRKPFIEAADGNEYEILFMNPTEALVIWEDVCAGGNAVCDEENPDRLFSSIYDLRNNEFIGVDFIGYPDPSLRLPRAFNNFKAVISEDVADILFPGNEVRYGGEKVCYNQYVRGNLPSPWREEPFFLTNPMLLFKSGLYGNRSEFYLSKNQAGNKIAVWTEFVLLPEEDGSRAWVSNYNTQTQRWESQNLSNPDKLNNKINYVELFNNGRGIAFGTSSHLEIGSHSLWLREYR